MPALATELEHPPIADRRQARRSALRLFEPGGPTLEDVIVAAWEDLVADGRADCPVCGSTMRVVGGCDSCGADLL